MILPIIGILLAAIFKACADTLVHHYSQSIFSRYNPQFFNPNISWLNKYVGHDKSKGIKKWCIQGFSDGWHCANTGMIGAFISLPFVVPAQIQYYYYPAAGLLFVLVFNLFYNIILKKS